MLYIARVTVYIDHEGLHYSLAKHSFGCLITQVESMGCQLTIFFFKIYIAAKYRHIYKTVCVDYLFSESVFALTDNVVFIELCWDFFFILEPTMLDLIANKLLYVYVYPQKRLLSDEFRISISFT